MGIAKPHIRRPRGARWQALRHAVLERDGWRCVLCGERGKLEVDHEVPLHVDPTRAWDPANCRSLCVSCHLDKSLRELGHEPDPERRAWRKAVAELATNRARKETPCLIQ